MKEENDRFLIMRNGRWHYNRRVPGRYFAVESRRFIRSSLKTKSLDVARMRRDALEDADNAYWQALMLDKAQGNERTEIRKVMHQRYEAARSRALAFGFSYKPMQALLEKESVGEILDRLKVLETSAGQKPLPNEIDAEALLGLAAEPDGPNHRVSDAFALYVEKIAFDAQFKKSPSQRKSWEKAKRTSVDYFVNSVGDMIMAEITREHALEYRNWWMDRIANGDEKGFQPTPYTANRHIGNLRTLYTSYFSYTGEEGRSNPFRKLSFKEDRKTTRPPFSDEWVRTKILVPGIFDGLNEQLKAILYILIETGARPSEICNLHPENILLDVEVPYIQIREKKNREVKASDSNRDIPLVGVALKAAKSCPSGFPRYFDKETTFSAAANKAFRSRNLFPSSNHKIYSFRHSMEKRMLEAGIDYGLRCTLMGTQKRSSILWRWWLIRI